MRITKRNIGTASIWLFFLLQSNALLAQDFMPDSMIRERIQLIQHMLDQGKTKANIWWYGWLAGYGAATIVQGGIALANDKLATRQDMALGAVTTLLGMGGQIIAPMVPGKVPDKLRDMPEGNREDLINKLEEAEKLLEKSAMREKDGRSWKTHTLDGAVNVACGFVVWFGFKRTFLDGLENVALNTAICEAQIFTQPMRAVKDYRTYCRQFKPDRQLSLKEPRVTWSFTMVPGGLGIRLSF